MKHRLIVVPGWAHDEADVSVFVSCLQSRFDVSVVSVSDLCRLGCGSFAIGLKQITQVSEGTFSIVGWSLGAVIALEAVALLGVSPERMVLFNATARFCRDREYRCGQPVRSVMDMESGLVDNPLLVLTAFYKNAYGVDDYKDNEVVERIERILSAGTNVLSAGLTYLRETDLRDVVCRLNIPTLVVHGGNDRIIPSEAGSYLASKLCCAEFMLHEDAAHAIIVSNGRRAAEDVVRFLDSEL